MWLVDSLKSLVTGLGGAKDKTISQVYVFQPIADDQLNAMHRSDWLARKIVDIIPNDMTREWRDWQADAARIELIETLEKSPLISVQLKVNEALRKARLLGGAGIYLGMRDGLADQPLDVERVGKGDLLYLHVMHRRELTCGPLDRDVTSEFFGQPTYYELFTGATAGATVGIKIHPSRFIRFVGADVLDNRQSNQDGWGDSILQVVYDAVQNATSSQEHIAALIPEAKSDVIYVPNLSEYLRSSATTKLLTDRFTYANMMKSMFNMTLLEGNGPSDQAQGERWEQKQINFATLPEIAAQFLQVAAGAADIPVTRLVGQAPKGLNATGESDLRNYYDNISARQRTELAPQLHRLDEVVIRSALGTRDPAIYYTWAPLWGLSEKEKADIFSTKATGARTLAGTGGASPPLLPIDALSDALVNSFIEDGSLPGLEAAIEEFGTLAEQQATQLEQEGALPPRANANVLPLPKAANDAAPRTLYVRRDLLNGADLVAWAKGQGFTSTLPAGDMHVTITFSRQSVDWMKMGTTWSDDKKGNLAVAPGGARIVDRLGTATVLLFNSSDLSWRHEDMVRNGASFDFEDYQPHVTISYDGAPADLSKVEPYRGELRFGPEIFEEVNEDGKASITEA